MKILYYHFPIIDSTNTFAKLNFSQYDKEALTVISASSQTAGRGRFQRNWISPTGNIYLTFVLFEDIHPFFATQIAAIAVDDVLHTLGVHSRIKWPNDLVVERKKIGGILTEKVDDALIIGIGLNVSLTKDDLKNISQPATSILIETKQLLSVDAVLENIVQRFYTLIQKPDQKLQTTWLERASWMIGETFVLTQPHSKNFDRIEGCVKSITREGKLHFIHLNGKEEIIRAGDLESTNTH